MFSRLDSYFTATIRHAESADARLGIRRDEQRDQGRKKSGKDEKDNEAPAWEDSTVVSVRALQAFLESLTADQLPAAEAAAPVSVPQQPSSRQAADAARAYQSTARSSAPPAPAQAAAGDRPVLAPDELDTIDKLISDLKFLAGRGVEQLNILRSDSFLQSLVDAAARARNAL
jgi:hypothetical protein